MRSNAVIIIAAGLIGAGLVAGPVAADDMPGGRFAQTITMPHIPDTTVDSAKEDGTLSPRPSPLQFLFILLFTLRIPVTLRLRLL